MGKRRFEKGRGLTESERVLATLCERSFLALWSYPNLFRAPSKELADLIVVFGDDVIIFSDKSCEFPDTGDENLDWRRWFRKSIAKSAAQLTRAENWILQHPQRIYLDAAATRWLPISMPSRDRIRIHRVLVALNSDERCRVATGSTSLGISPDTLDDTEPFAVGHLSDTNGWFHVFDGSTLRVVLSELSTVADFLDYLRKKEAIYAEGKYAGSRTELDLLAYFLWNGRSFPTVERERWTTDVNLWAKLESDPQFLAGREENKISAFWDGLIEYVNDLYMREELEHGNDHDMSAHEQMLRILASETRFGRRIGSKWLLDRAALAKEGFVGSLRHSERDDVVYVLLAGPGDGGKDHATYRESRKNQLTARCLAAKAACPERRFVLGIGIDAIGIKGTSEDFILFDTIDWSADQLAAAQEIRQTSNFFMGQQKRLREDEYPVV